MKAYELDSSFFDFIAHRTHDQDLIILNCGRVFAGIGGGEFADGRR